MKIKNILSVSIVFLLTLQACKKESSTATPEQPLLQDGPLSAQLGKLIYLGSHGYSRSTPYWGRNSDELFITAVEILRVDIVAKKIEVLGNPGNLVTGKTNENSGVIFLGKINNQNGYHVYNFSSNSTEKIISVPDNVGARIDIAGNNIFYYETAVSIPGPPCNGYCWPPIGPFEPATFYHLDKQTQQITDLKNKQFILFSADGSRAILSSQQGTRMMYVFENNSKTIIDSSDVNGYRAPWGVFFHNGLLQSFEIDVLGNLTIKNFTTGQILRQHPLNYFAIDDIRISTDGSRLYFSGGILNGNSMKIILYDIETNTEKIIADLPFPLGSGVPYGSSFVLSDDNTKMVVQVENDLYLKVLD